MKHSAHARAAADWRPVALIVTTALLLKLLVLTQLWNHPLLQPHGQLDTAYFIELGRRIAAEGVLAPIGAFFVSPLYVYFLAAVFAVGAPPVAAQAIQAVLGAIAVGLLFSTARHWFGRPAALTAAALATLTGIFTFNEVLILQSALDPFLVSLTLYALTRAIAARSRWAFLLAGVAVGMLALNRPNALLYGVAVTAAVLIYELRRHTGAPRVFWRRVEHGVVLAAALLAVLALNAARNYAVSGEAVLIASHGGLNFYIGNHARADGTYTPVPGVTPSIAGQAGDTARVAETALGRQLTSGEVSDYFLQQALDWIASHPADAVRLTLRKTAILLNHADVPLNHSYAFYAQEPFSLLRVLFVGPWLLLPLGLVGLFWPALRVHREGFWVWAMFVPVYGATVVLFFVADRYRMPIFVPLCATAGAALIRIVELARARQAARLMRPAAALLTTVLLVFANLGLDDGASGEQTRRAVWLVQQGSVDEARRYVEEISDAHSHPGVLRYRVGDALLAAGHPDDAARLLQQAIEIDGPQPALRLALGEALLRSGRTAEAVPHLEAVWAADFEPYRAAPLLVRALVMAGRTDDAVRRLPSIPGSIAGEPGGADAALDFGTLALERGVLGEAIRWFRLAVQQAPNRAEAHEKLGLSFFLSGDARAALPHLELARQLDPRSASANLNLAILYAEFGRFGEARQLADEAIRLEPGDPRALAFRKALPE